MRALTAKTLHMKSYRFDHFKDFYALQISQAKQKSQNKKSDTLQLLAKKLGYNSPSLFSMIAKGKRLPSAALLEALLEKWEIPHNEREGIRVQVEIERRLKNSKEVLPLLDRLKKLQGSTHYRHLDFNQFEVIRHWYVYVLKEMITAKSFIEDAVIISRRLRNKVTPAQVRKGLDALLTVGLIRRNKDTHKLESTVKDTETSNGIPSEAIQQHHRSMLERAIEAIVEQKVNERHLNSVTLRFDPKNLDIMRDKIFAFVKQINEEMQSEESDRVYQLNVQFFEHTRAEKKGEIS